IPAAGLGTRMGKVSPESPAGRKQFFRLADSSVLVHTLRQFIAASTIGETFVAVRDEDRETLAPGLAADGSSAPARLATGGRSRQASVENCRARLDPDVDLAAVHAAVRPLIQPALLDKAVRQAYKDGAVILRVPPIDTVKRVD